MDIGKCDICDYKPTNQKEVNNWFKYGCCRPVIEQLGGEGVQIQTCLLDRQTGKYYPATPDVEDVEAFKETFVKKYDEKGNKNKPK
jgi:hypothetical protein